VIGEQTVTVTAVVTTRDKYGDETTATTTTTVPRALFEPQQSTERTDTHTPGVVTPAKFYLPVALSLNADDTITDATSVVWSVVGGSSVWVDQTEVPVVRASAV
jgi:hypothetical protein